MFIIRTDHWISPNVSGDKPPPVHSFTLSKIANKKFLLYGGDTAQGPSSELRVATVLGDSVVSIYVLFNIGKILIIFEYFKFCQGVLGKSNKNGLHDIYYNSFNRALWVFVTVVIANNENWKLNYNHSCGWFHES